MSSTISVTISPAKGTSISRGGNAFITLVNTVQKLTVTAATGTPSITAAISLIAVAGTTLTATPDSGSDYVVNAPLV